MYNHISIENLSQYCGSPILEGHIAYQSMHIPFMSNQEFYGPDSLKRDHPNL